MGKLIMWNLLTLDVFFEGSKSGGLGFSPIRMARVNASVKSSSSPFARENNPSNPQAPTQS
jgi:hypothetical protein